MTPATADQVKLLRAWADNAIAQMPTCPDPAAWIVANRIELGHAERHANDAWVKIKAALDARWKQLEAAR